MKLILTALLTTLIVCGLVLVNSAHFSWAQPEPAIVINSDGTITTNSDGVITPSTAPITQTGTTYTLTGDLTNREIWVATSNVILDGNGYNINRLIVVARESNVTIQNWNSIGGISLSDVSNVSILNSTLTGGDLPWYETGAISIAYSSSVKIIGNTIANGDIGILMSESHDNLIMKNTITGMSTGWSHASAGIMLYDSSNNIIHHNNFINDTLGAGIEGLNSVNNSWDDSSPSGGNYWGDYQSRYPNASEADNSGTWNTPYAIDANNTDYHPLINQVDITSPPSTPTPSPTPILSPTLTPSPTSSPSQIPTLNPIMTPSPSVPEFPTWIILPLFIVATLLAVVHVRKKTEKTAA